jgi:hypothetical protein
MPPPSGRWLIALMMEAVNTSEKSVNVYQFTRRNKPKTAIFTVFSNWEQSAEQYVVSVGHLGCLAMWACRQITTLWKNTLHPYSVLCLETVFFSKSWYLSTSPHDVTSQSRQPRHRKDLKSRTASCWLIEKRGVPTLSVRRLRCRQINHYVCSSETLKARERVIQYVGGDDAASELQLQYWSLCMWEITGRFISVRPSVPLRCRNNICRE